MLVATATLAWGVNLPAHLVIVKGTEYFDGKLKRYVDFDITDVLQMTGRAGEGKALDSSRGTSASYPLMLVSFTRCPAYEIFNSLSQQATLHSTSSTPLVPSMLISSRCPFSFFPRPSAIRY